MYRIASADGHEAAEQLLNESIGRNEDLVHTHIAAVRGDASGEQENVMLSGGASLSRFTFIFLSRGA